MDEREDAIEKYLGNTVAVLGGACYKFGPPGRVGYPDRLVVLPGGRMFFVELKRPKGGRLAVAQAERHKELRALGVTVYNAKNRGEIDGIVQSELRSVGAAVRPG